MHKSDTCLNGKRLFKESALQIDLLQLCEEDSDETDACLENLDDMDSWLENENICTNVFDQTLLVGIRHT